MKRYILILAILIQISTISGQTIFLKVGPSISKLSTDATPGASNVIEEKSLIGINAIVCLDYLDHKYYNLSSGFGFIQGGGKEEIATIWSPYQIENISVKLNYLTLNTTCKLKIPIKEIFEPFIIIGPRVDYLVSYSHVSDLFNTNPKTNKMLYGFLLGGGINFKINKIVLGLECDYYLNFNKVINNQEQDETMSVYIITVNAVIGFKL